MQWIKNLAVGFIFLAVAVVVLWQGHTASSAGSRFDLDKATSTAAEGATTTVQHLNPSFPSFASSTIEFASANTDHIDMNVQFNASSTNSTLQWVIYHSHNRIDWYCEMSDAVVSTGTTTIATYGAKCKVHQWTPGKSGISRRSIPLADIGTRFMRVVFNTKDDNGTLYAEEIARKPN